MLISHADGLQPGDVLMVAKEIRDKQDPRKTLMWRHFAMVTKTFKHSGYYVEVVVLDDRERKPTRLSFLPTTVVHLLPPEQWPDGVHALRMRVILNGQVTDLN